MGTYQSTPSGSDDPDQPLLGYYGDDGTDQPLLGYSDGDDGSDQPLLGYYNEPYTYYSKTIDTNCCPCSGTVPSYPTAGQPATYTGEGVNVTGVERYRKVDSNKERLHIFIILLLLILFGIFLYNSK